MQIVTRSQFIRLVLFSNGVVDLFAAIALFFPALSLPLPGYASYSNDLAFVGGGWGIATLALGVGRIWASYKPEFYYIMVPLGLLEGGILAIYCLISVLFLGISLIQAILPLAVGSLYGTLYFLALLALLRLDRPS